MQRPTHESRIRPLEAWRAFRTIVQNPEDTQQVGVVLGALEGRGDTKTLERLLRRPDGEAILARGHSLADVLADREHLAGLPAGSLGRAYLDYMVREQLTVEGVTDLAEAFGGESDTLARALRDRLLAMHDLFHVVTGYGRDLMGEAALLAFTFAQIRTRGIGFILGLVYGLSWRRLPSFLRPRFLHEPPPGFEDPQRIDELRARLREAYRRGREAGWLVAADWEALLDLPLEEVRRRYGIVPVDYAEIRSQGAPPPVVFA